MKKINFVIACFLLISFSTTPISANFRSQLNFNASPRLMITKDVTEFRSYSIFNDTHPATLDYDHVDTACIHWRGTLKLVDWYTVDAIVTYKYEGTVMGNTSDGCR